MTQCLDINCNDFIFIQQFTQNYTKFYDIYAKLYEIFTEFSRIYTEIFTELYEILRHLHEIFQKFPKIVKRRRCLPSILWKFVNFWWKFAKIIHVEGCLVIYIIKMSRHCVIVHTTLRPQGAAGGRKQECIDAMSRHQQ